MEEIIPSEGETIAAKRSQRLTERLLMRAKDRVLVPRGWWTSTLIEYLGLAVLVGFTVHLISPQWGRASVDGVFSGPAIPYLAQFLKMVFGIRFRLSVQYVEIFFFILFPITMYFLVHFLTRRKLIALFAVLFASLPESVFAKARLLGGFYVGDAQHIASLGVVPLAMLVLLSFLRRGGFGHLLISALLSSVILLISPFGFLTYLVFALVSTFSEMLLGYGRLKLVRFVTVFVLTACLVAFWYNPGFSTWLLFGPSGKEFRVAAGQLLPVSLVIVPVLGTLGFLLFDRKPHLQPLFLAIGWTIIFSLLVAVSRLGTLPLVPSRFLPELGIAVSFLLAVTAVVAIDTLKQSKIRLFRMVSDATFSNSVTTFLLLVLTVAILWPRATAVTHFEEEEVTRESMAKGALWLIRDDFDGPSLVSGYIITGATLVGLAGVGLGLFAPRKGKPS